MNSGLRVVSAIVAKDLRLFARDRFYSLITVIGLVAFGAIFWVLPSTVVATIPVGIHLPGFGSLVGEELEDRAADGLEIEVFQTSTDLQAAVSSGGELVAGLDFPGTFLDDVVAGRPTTVRLLVAGGAPEALAPALRAAVIELVGVVAGEEGPIVLPDVQEMIVGEDRAGRPLPPRDQFRPLIVLVVLMMEMFALAALVAAEISQRTVTAVLVTPATVRQFLAAKVVLGTVLAFSQALLIGLLTVTVQRSAAILTLTLLLGAVLVTGFGLLAGSTGQDFVGIVFWSVLFFVPLAIPGIAILFPGSPATWIQLLPSYGLVEVLWRVVVEDRGWTDVAAPLLTLAAWCAAVFAVGTLVLARRVRRA